MATPDIEAIRQRNEHRRLELGPRNQTTIDIDTLLAEIDRLGRTINIAFRKCSRCEYREPRGFREGKFIAGQFVCDDCADDEALSGLRETYTK